MDAISEYKSAGYFLGEGVLGSEPTAAISQIQDLFRLQFSDPSGDFDDGLVELFRRDPRRYVHINRTCTQLEAVYGLAYNPHILGLLRVLGLRRPILCQKPTVRMDSALLATSPEYFRLPAHQDYRAMQGSINSVVVSIPLVDVDESLGALMVVPGSHKWGLLDSRSSVHGKSKLEAIRAVEVEGFEAEFRSIPQRTGDILVISSFLLHRSGTNVLDRPRYTVLIRYNDLEDPSFVERGFPSPFKMTHDDTIDESFPYMAWIREFFGP